MGFAGVKKIQTEKSLKNGIQGFNLIKIVSYFKFIKN